MADYKELLRRAVQALPENNGQARRAVYEKARAALVGQLRAINPPLAARDITTHRLQLEDCIRQVEQEASEAVIAGMQEPPPQAKVQATNAPKLAPRPPGKPQPAPAEPPMPTSIEAIIAAAEFTEPEAPPRVEAKAAAKAPARPPQKPEVRSPRIEVKAAAPSPQPMDEEEDDELPPPAPKVSAKSNGRAGRPLPSIVARAEAVRNRAANANGELAAAAEEKPHEGGRRAPTLQPRRESGPRLEAAMRGQAAVRKPAAQPFTLPEEPAIVAAMSSVREVEVEAADGPAVAVDPQGAIDRAIATLDREARGEAEHGANGSAIEMPEPEVDVSESVEDETVEGPARPARQARRGIVGGMFRDRARADRNERADRKEHKPAGRREARGRRDATPAEAVFQRPPVEHERGSAAALTIFLAVFAVLLLCAGGLGIWAWREGYINLDSMFARSTPAPVTASVTPPEPASALAADGGEATGPGNTVTPEPDLAVATEPKPEERLAPTATETTPTAAEPLALASPSEPLKTEERLSTDDDTVTPTAAETAIAALDPATAAGSQSLLLEASDSGATGAVPFSGTVEWSKGKDETGLPTLVANATIPARNLSVYVLIRKNSDPSLPASHLMEINFTVSQSFIGGSIAGLPGVLLKNEELVQGAPLVGASARVIGNHFLFALSATPSDSAANVDLLTSRKWVDLAIIYATGKRAIITLEKDETADKLFHEVFDAWAATASSE